MNINNNLYTAIITPMFDNGDVDYFSFEKLLKFRAFSLNCVNSFIDTPVIYPQTG
jgi:hypothetical protein